MRIALISDIHGNNHGLEAILENIAKEKPDQILCAGDLISPFPDSPKTWQRMRDLNIPLLRGNHEDYIIAAHLGAENSLARRAVRFMPVRYVAKLFSTETIRTIQPLPISMILTAPDGKQAMVCHASPLSNNQSFANEKGIDETMATALRKVPASIILGGHLHKHWYQKWENKHLHTIGSGGLPLRGKPDTVDYMILEYNKKEWTVHRKEVRYDYHAAIQSVLDSSYLDESGPIGQLLFLELVTQERQVMTFFHFSKFDPWPDEEDYKVWDNAVKRYLDHVNLRQTMQDYLRKR